MLTMKIWEDFVPSYFWGYKYYEGIKVLIGILLTLITIPLDILLCPLEIIAFIVMKILEKVSDIE